MNNLNKTIGVIGMGVVGMAVYKGFSAYAKVLGYDKNPLLSPNSLLEVISSNIIFLCLPTPSDVNGAADISSIHACIKEILDSKKYDPNTTTLVLKSTVPVGTTKQLEQQYGIGIVHCPEFLSAKTAQIDFITSTRVIIGSNSDSKYEQVKAVFLDRFPGINVIKTSSDESELIKYFLNCFYATKISFFNEIKLLSDKLACDWASIMRGVLSSPWIEKMHTDVPGHDGKLGFGGSCFPKDTEALSHIFGINNIDSLILDAVILQNKRIRGE